MTLGILLFAIAPPYSTIGIGAPLLIEAAPFSKRGVYGSFQMASQAASLLLGALVGAAISRGLSPQALESWGGTCHSYSG